MDYVYFKPSSERLAEALERALHYWRARGGPVPVEVRGAPAPPPFTVALSYEAGVDGAAVARALQERLGWHVYDHELVEMIAEQLGVGVNLLESVDERHVSWLEEFVATFLAIPDVSEGAYVQRLVATIVALAAHGECVLVGRGAAQLLPEQTTLRVRLVGPLRERVATVAQRLGIPPDQAARRVEETDREHNAFVKDHFGKDPADPDGYDLLLNAFRIPPAECAGLVAQALGCLQARAAVRERSGPGR